MIWLWLALGLTLLVAGADLLVRGAVGVASAMRVSPLVIGLTIVAFGTSAPECIVSLQAALAGQPEIAVGNVIGSNIFNVLVILGISAAIVPLRVDRKLVRLDVPLMIAVSIVVYGMALDGSLSRLEGAALVAGLVAYTAWTIRASRAERDPAVLGEYVSEFSEPSPSTPRRIWLQILAVGAGLALLVAGADLFVDAAASLARAWGVSELVIGLTLVAAGTSLPELATTAVAALKGERDIAVGNVVGSNLFNLTGVLGLTSLIAPGGLPVAAEAISQDLPMMVLAALACLPVFLIGHTIGRWEGGLLLAFFVLYTLALVSEARGNERMLAAVETAAWGLVALAVAAYASLILAGRGRQGGPAGPPESPRVP